MSTAKKLAAATPTRGRGRGSSGGGASGSVVAVEVEVRVAMTSSDEDIASFRSMTPDDIKRLHAKNYTSSIFLLKMHNDLMSHWEEVRETAVSTAASEAELDRLDLNESINGNGTGRGGGASKKSSKSHQIKLIQSNRVSLATVTRNLDKVHWGKFLLCRVIAPPFILGCLQTVVDDPEGLLAARLMIYNFAEDIYPNGASLEEGNEMVPVGTVLAVKNPIFMSSTNRGFRLMVNNWRNDVVVMDEAQLESCRLNIVWMGEIRDEYTKYIKTRTALACSKPPPSQGSALSGSGMSKRERKGSFSGKCKTKPNSGPGCGPPGCTCCPIPLMDWKRIGNEYFVKKEYTKAIHAYNPGLVCDPTSVDLLANRAAAFLNTDQFQYALYDCEAVLKHQPSHGKGVFRKMRALWGLKRYEDAKVFLEDVLKNHDQKTLLPREVVELTTKTTLFIQQSKHGVYNMKEVASKCCTSGDVEWAEYQLRNSVEVRETKDGKGRGMFATAPISRGKLILVSKALLHVPCVKLQDIDSRKIFGNLDLDKTRTALVEKLCTMISENPDRGRVYKLYAGEMGHLDAFKGMNTGMDPLRIGKLVRHNMFGFGANIQIGDSSSSVGIWPGAGFSFINHACVGSNAHWMVHGDIMMVRAARDISVDEEITIAYVLPTRDYIVRRQACEWLGFTCKCEACEYDRAETEDVARQRKKYMCKFKLLIERTPGNGIGYSSFTAPFVIHWLDWLQELRPKYNLYLHGILSMLINHFEDTQDCEQSLQFRQLQIIWSTGVAQMAESVFRNLLSIVDTYLQLGQVMTVRKCLDLLREATLTAYGTLDVLDPKYVAAIERNNGLDSTD